MSIELRDRTFGEVIGLTFQLILQRLGALIAISALFGLPSLFFSIVSEQDPNRMSDGDAAVGFGSVVLMLVLLPLQTAASIQIVAGEMTGERRSVAQALTRAFEFLLPLIGLGILTGVAIFFGVLLLVIPGLILATIWYVATPSLIVEGKGVFDALGRSSELTRGSRWEVFGFLFFFRFIAIVFGVLVGAIFGVLGLPMDSLGWHLIAWVIEVVAELVNVVAPVAVYFNLRVRREGFDVSELSRFVTEIGRRRG